MTQLSWGQPFPSSIFTALHWGQKPHGRPSSRETLQDGFTDKLTSDGKQQNKGTKCIKSNECKEICNFPAVGLCEQALLYVAMCLWPHKILRTIWYFGDNQKVCCIVLRVWTAKEMDEPTMMQRERTEIWKRTKIRKPVLDQPCLWRLKRKQELLHTVETLYMDQWSKIQ